VGNRVSGSGFGAVVAAGVGMWAGWRSGTVNSARTAVLQEFSTQQTTTRSTLEAVRERLDALDQEIAKAAQHLGLLPQPTNHDVESAERQVARLTTARREFDAKSRELAKAQASVSRVTGVAQAARMLFTDGASARDEAVHAWTVWKREAAVPTELSPQGVLDFFEAVRVGRDELHALENAERDVASAIETVENFENHARRILVAAGEPAADRGHLLAEASERLRYRIERDRDTRRRRDTLLEVVRRCDRGITEVLGKGFHADAMREELESGEVERWRATASAAAEEASALQDTRDHAVAARREQEVKRQQVAESADVSRLELERAGLLEQLREAVRELRVLAMAEGLIRETLARYERERQPEVLKTASRLFAGATSGHYERLFRPLNQDGGLQIQDRNGVIIRPSELSRGTMEQLYLSVRLGLADSFSTQSRSLPLVMDDVMVNFDPERARAIGAALCSFAGSHQILVFTCHPATAQLFRDLDPSCGLVVMERYGEHGSHPAVSGSAAV